MKIALTVPTRGIVFAKTIQSAILSPELPDNTTVHIVDGLSIPASHNRCIELAIEDGATHIFFVEDDMYIPRGVITEMIEEAKNGRPYVCCDYKMAKNATVNTAHDDGRRIWWTGFGCTLIDVSLFLKKKKPYLEADKTVFIDRMRPLQYRIVNTAPDDQYGMYDILFGIWCHDNNVPLYVLPNRLAGHLRTEAVKRVEKNNGLYSIDDLSGVLDTETKKA